MFRMTATPPRCRRCRAVLVAITVVPLLPVYAAERETCQSSESFVLALHGGTIDRHHPADVAAPYLALVESVLDAGRERLAAGGSALDTVETAVRALEDSGMLNAGRFATANQSGFVETDASIMDGRTMNAGAVASMLTLKNPVSGARLVMEQSPQVLMVGDRGEAYVRALGAETVSADYFINNGAQEDRATADDGRHGTVGAVALDRCGNLAAATSTGGFGAKVPGRVGDSPIVGAGTYAENGVVAISATGHGEFFIRYAVAHDIRSRIAYLGETARQAADRIVVDKLGALAAEGGVVTVTPDGKWAMAFNSVGMLRGAVSNTKAPFVAAY